MCRVLPPLALLLCLVAARPVRADAFDHYLNPILGKALSSEQVKEVKELTPDQIGDNDRVLQNIPAAFVIVRTNENRLAKLLLQAGRQKIVVLEQEYPSALFEVELTHLLHHRLG